jgi:hypothetical protein
MPSSKTITPTRSPTTSATTAIAAVASMAASSRVSVPMGAPIRRPESITQITSRSCSTRHTFAIGRCMRPVACQFTDRMSSSSV